MKLPISEYRGVVWQPNGKWGVQICKNKRQIWLGTFCTEVEAAETYDLAAQALHGCRAKTNFKPLSPPDGDSWVELLFLRSLPTTEVVNMLQLHTNVYQHMRQYNAIGQPVLPDQYVVKRNHYQLLFSRVISLSDISTKPQTRLQIPRQNAAGKHCRCPFGVRRGIVQFEDERGKLWRFRYTLYRGCHNLKGGWAYFVRKKRIKQGDIISFWRMTDELGAVRFLIHSDYSSNVVPSRLVQPQPNNYVRLFGVNIPIPK